MYEKKWVVGKSRGWREYRSCTRTITQHTNLTLALIPTKWPT